MAYNFLSTQCVKFAMHSTPAMAYPRKADTPDLNLLSLPLVCVVATCLQHTSKPQALPLCLASTSLPSDAIECA